MIYVLRHCNHVGIIIKHGIPDNREDAKKRLHSLEKSLLKKPEVARRYKEAIDEREY